MATSSIDFHKFLQVVVLIGPGAGGDGGGYGWRNGKIVKIPGNNPEVRRLIAAAEAAYAVDRVGAEGHLSELGRVAHAAMAEAATEIGQKLESSK